MLFRSYVMRVAYVAYVVYEEFAGYEGLKVGDSYYKILSTYIGRAVNMSRKTVALSMRVT